MCRISLSGNRNLTVTTAFVILGRAFMGRSDTRNASKLYFAQPEIGICRSIPSSVPDSMLGSLWTTDNLAPRRWRTMRDYDGNADRRQAPVVYAIWRDNGLGPQRSPEQPAQIAQPVNRLTTSYAGNTSSRRPALTRSFTDFNAVQATSRGRIRAGIFVTCRSESRSWAACTKPSIPSIFRQFQIQRPDFQRSNL